MLLAVASLLLAACSTPGPAHLYSVADRATTIHDVALTPDRSADTPSCLAAGDELLGFAYDPFTDHLFLRLAPGNHIRVVDRPARKIKLEFDLEGVDLRGGGDLAVCPRTGHIYFIDRSAATLVETTRFGKFVGRVTLAGRSQPAAAIAFDMRQEQLLVLDGDGRAVSRFTRGGDLVGTLTLEDPVGRSLGYDADRRELYGIARDHPNEVSVFDEQGRRVRTIPIAAGDTFLDVGPHSFFRMF